MTRSLGAQAAELLEVVEEVWGRDAADAIRRDADAISDAAQDPRSMTRNYHVYLAAGIPMPLYVREEFSHFLAHRTELAAGRKMTSELREWLVGTLNLLGSRPNPPG
jgi:hypothetical protein